MKSTRIGFLYLYCIVFIFNSNCAQDSQQIRKNSLFSRSSSSSLNSPKSLTRALSLNDCRLVFSEFAEPALNNTDQFEEDIRVLGINTVVKHEERSVTIFPEGTIPQASLITADLLKTDLGDVSGSVMYDEIKKMCVGKHMPTNAQLFYTAVVAQSVRKKLREYFAIRQRLTELRDQTGRLLPLITDSSLKTFHDTLEQVSRELIKIPSSSLDEQKVHDLEMQVLKQGVRPLELTLREACILKPCNPK